MRSLEAYSAAASASKDADWGVGRAVGSRAPRTLRCSISITPSLAPGSAAKVGHDRLADIGRQRQRVLTTALAMDQQRPGPPVDVVQSDRGDLTGDITQSKSSPHDRSRAGARCDPAHVRQVLGWWTLLRGFQSLVPHVYLSVSLAEPAPSGSTDTARRCQGLLHHPPPYRGRWPSSSYQTPAATGIQRCPLTTARSKNASWRSKSATQS